MTEYALSFLDALLRDDAVAMLIGTEADCAAMLDFELALAEAEAVHGLIPEASATEIRAAGSQFLPDLTSLAASTLRDGVVIPDFVKQLRAHIGGDAATHVHFGATSQDVIDTALALKLKPVLALFEQRLQALIALLDGLILTQGGHAIMGRTRMQAAIAITAGDRLRAWRGPLVRALADLEPLRRDVLILSLAGAAGTSEKFGAAIEPVRKTLARKLGLTAPDYVPHAQRDRFAKLGSWLGVVTGALGKIGQDAALMAQNEIAEIKIAGGGGSSAMAHKQNPVLAETLVTLARFNAVQSAGLQLAMVHEQERSGSSWTLEWMILPAMLNAAGVALSHAEVLLSNVISIGAAD